MDPLYNCLLLVCCDPLTDNRVKAMARLLCHAGDFSPEEADRHAPGVLKALQPLFDVLQPFIGFIARLARGADFKE